MENKTKRLLADAGGVGLGAMELAINANRPDIAEARNIIDNLVEEDGLSFIDTADCYCWGEEEFGYCERLLAPFAKRDNLLIASKIGMRREGTSWIKCGTPKYLRSACELSLKHLGVEAIDLCQFHAPDPKVPLSESIGELSRLCEEGKIQALGVCNVSLDELQLISAVVDVASVQNRLSILFYDPAIYDPMLRYCEEKSIPFIAFAPFGGHRNPQLLRSISDLNTLANSAGLPIYQLSLLFLKTLSPMMLAIPGSISKPHIIENLSVKRMTLSPTVKAQIIEQINRT